MSENQARDSRGRFASGGESDARNAGTYPVQSHNGQQSVGTHASRLSAKQERIAILKNVDARYGKRNVYHG